MHDELLTLQKMAIRRPDLYANHANCPVCKEEVETLAHLLSCKERKESWKEVWEKSIAKPFEHLMGKIQEKKESIKTTIKINLTETRTSLQEILQILKEEVVESPESTKNFAIGLLRKNT
jgi:chromatin segregation and condensation protein Rec8/ScpA/Scc1 (kleisin family)